MGVHLCAFPLVVRNGKNGTIDKKGPSQAVH